MIVNCIKCRLAVTLNTRRDRRIQYYSEPVEHYNDVIYLLYS